MITIDVGEADRASGGLAPEKLQAALDALRTDGLLVLADVVDLEHLDVLHERMVSDLALLRARPDAPYNWTAGNIQQDPPPFAPYLFEDVLLNPQVIAVTSAILGPGLRNVMYSGNTSLPSDTRQPVHADMGHLWPSGAMEVAHPPAQLVVNVPTVDVSAENGATEIWPGTHLDLTVGVGGDIEVPPDALAARRAISPPIQPDIRRGSVLIRDVRLWHAGMPNHTDRPRPMIAMVHVSHWLEAGTPLEFPASSKSFFEHPLLTTAARFTEQPSDHIYRSHGFGIEQQPIA
ncbi:phytanoyl-CoA dioxygenase family protein [Kribbella sp. NPDC003557]|uniref:phytanoyl-CoA dioxygenase family protein n=1 Tax=Kribbella sp. NPDC003557 TaxID=3154449 RepID=UPI00339FF0DA